MTDKGTNVYFRRRFLGLFGLFISFPCCVYAFSSVLLALFFFFPFQLAPFSHHFSIISKNKTNLFAHKSPMYQAMYSPLTDRRWSGCDCEGQHTCVTELISYILLRADMQHKNWQIGRSNVSLVFISKTYNDLDFCVICSYTPHTPK